MSATPQSPLPDEAHEAARERVAMPAMFLVANGALNLLVAGLLGAAGGVRMYQARSYALAVVGSLASLVPCVTPTSCCCLGSLVGAWCAWALLLPGVRAGFR